MCRLGLLTFTALDLVVRGFFVAFFAGSCKLCARKGLEPMTNQQRPAERVLVLVSGGVDSFTLLAHLCSIYPAANVHALTFKYGQRCFREIEFAHRHAKGFRVSHTVRRIELEQDDGQVIREDGQAFTPYRNLVFASMAAREAATLGCSRIYMGLVDDGRFPDTSPAFVAAMQEVIWQSDKRDLSLVCPFLLFEKWQVYAMMARLGYCATGCFSCFNNVILEADHGCGCQVCDKCKANAEAWKTYQERLGR